MTAYSRGIRLTVAASCFLATAFLTYAVRSGAHQPFDHDALRCILDLRIPEIAVCAWIVTSLGSMAAVGFLTMVIAGRFYSIRDYARMKAIRFVFSSTALVTHLLKQWIDRPRPEFHEIPVHGSAFPSGHSAMSAAVYVTTALLFSQLAPKHSYWQWLLKIIGL